MQPRADLGGWSNDDLVTCLSVMGTDVISKQTLREIKNSALTGEEMVEFYKEAERSGAGSIEHQLPERIGRDQADALWGWLSQVMGAAAASETGEGHTLEEALEISIKVARWMFVKHGGKTYAVYQFDVVGPDGEKQCYDQRWSDLLKFKQKFEVWSRNVGLRDEHRSTVPELPKKATSTNEAKRLESRKMELNDWAHKLCAWANDAAAKHLINLDTFMKEVVVPCLGEQARGGGSPTGLRVSQAIVRQQEHAGWLNVVGSRANQSEPFYAVLAREPVKVKQRRGEPSSEGDDSGTFALYHGAQEKDASEAFSLSGKFVGSPAELGESSPRDMRGMHQFFIRWYDEGKRGKGLELKQKIFNASDDEVAEEWVRKCRVLQRESFVDWGSIEMDAWFQGTDVFGTDAGGFGLDPFVVKDYVMKDEKQELKRQLPRIEEEAFDSLWQRLNDLLIAADADKEAGADGDGAAPSDRCQPARPHSASWRISSLCLLRAPWLPLWEPAPFRLQHKRAAKAHR